MLNNFTELAMKLRKALDESSPNEGAYASIFTSSSTRYSLLIETLSTFCIESKDDFAVSQVRSLESKDSFVATVLEAIKQLTPNTVWSEDLYSFFGAFEDTCDKRYGKSYLV